MVQRFFLAGVLLSLMGSCLTPPDYSPIPQITFDSISKTYVKGNKPGNSAVLDSVTFMISFTDGDGDLGASSTDTSNNLFFKDSRTGFIYPFQFPYITPEGHVKAISGTISYTYNLFTCTPDHNIDTFFYTIFIADRAGHLSNEVASPQIICDCN